MLCAPSELATGENDAIACAVGAELGIPETEYLKNRALYQEDFGAQRCYPREHGRFYNLFSANDPVSTRLLLENSGLELSNLTLLYNNRADRPDRLLLFVRHFFPCFPNSRILVMGEARGLALRLLKKHGFQAQSVSGWQKALEAAGDSLVVGIGNIKGEAYEMVAWFEGGNHHE